MTIVTVPLTAQIANGTTNDATQVMANFNQIANNVNANAISTAGTTPFAGNQQMGGFKFTGLGAGNAVSDSLAWQQLFNQGIETALASSATTDIGTVTSNFINITGNTTITSFGTNYQGPRFLRFSAALTISGSATVNGVNINVSAGDVLVVTPTAASGTANGWIVSSGKFLSNQWDQSGPVPTFLTANTFSLIGNQTSEFHVNRRLQLAVTAGTVYGSIVSSVFSTVTTVTIIMDGQTVLDSGLSSVNLSILRADHLATPTPLSPVTVRQAIQVGPITGSPAVSNLIPQSEINNTVSTGVTLKNSTTPTFYSVANGFNVDGSPNNLNWIATADITIANLSVSSTNFIWVDVVAKTAGFVTLADIEGSNVTPSITNNQYTFDYNGYVMYLGNGTSASQVNRIIVAEIDTDTTKVIAIRCRAYLGQATVLLATLTRGTASALNHNIGSYELNGPSAFYYNKTAELGWAVNDRVPPVFGPSNVTPFFGEDKNVMTFIVANSAAGQVLPKGGGALSTITDANWGFGCSLRRKY